MPLGEVSGNSTMIAAGRFESSLSIRDYAGAGAITGADAYSAISSAASESARQVPPRTVSDPVEQERNPIRAQHGERQIHENVDARRRSQRLERANVFEQPEINKAGRAPGHFNGERQSGEVRESDASSPAKNSQQRQSHGSNPREQVHLVGPKGIGDCCPSVEAIHGWS